MSADDSADYGLFGSVFNPIHFGHLYAAEAAGDELGLARVLMVPARVPPHKDSTDVAPAEDRAAMIELAIDDNPRLDLSTVELERSGPSYTIETIEDLNSTLGRLPVLILGVDAFQLIRSWYRWEELIDRVPFALVARPGYDTSEAAELADQIGARVVCLVEDRGVDVSSTLLRRRIDQGKTIRYLTPDPVVQYLARRSLYRASDGG